MVNNNYTQKNDIQVLNKLKQFRLDNLSNKASVGLILGIGSLGLAGIILGIIATSKNDRTSTKENKNIKSSDNAYSELGLDISTQSNPFINEDIKIQLFGFEKKAGIKSYTPTILRTDNDAIFASHESLIGLIKYYEGDRYHYYEPIGVKYKDAYNTATSGFGTLNTQGLSYNDGYTKLLNHLNNTVDEVKRNLGDENYNKLPASVKEGILDLCYCKGLPALMKVIDNIKEAINSEDWATVIKNLDYVTSAKTTAKKVDDPGLYRRSLSRMILATRDLSKTEKKEAKKVIDAFYEKAKTCPGQSMLDLEKTYEAYTTGKITKTPFIRESSKHIVQAKESYWSIAQKYTPQGESIKDFSEHLLLINHRAELHPGNAVNIPLNFNGKKVNIEPVIQPVEQPQVNNENNTDNVTTITQNANEDNVIISDEEIEISSLDKMFQSNMSYTEKNVNGFTVLDFSYNVQKGDTFYKIANRFGIDWKTLQQYNNLSDPKNLSIGQQITIPKVTYNIKKGDTIYKIAQAYGLDKDFILSTNCIYDVSKLQPGQKIELPGYIYTVKSGDNLTQIAQKVKMDLKDILRVNNIKDKNSIKIGQELVILFNNGSYNMKVENIPKEDADGNKVEETVTIADANIVGNRKYLVPGTPCSKHIFQPTVSNGPLTGKRIIVNAGHGYKFNSTIFDPGAHSDEMHDEWLENYDNAMNLIKALQNKGATVIYIQGNLPDAVKPELQKNEKNIDLFISVHCNSVAKAVKDRPQLIYRPGSNHLNGKKFAEISKSNFDTYIKNNEKINENDKFYNNGKQEYSQAISQKSRTMVLEYAQTLNPRIPAIIWEVAYISSKKGRERLNNEPLMKNYANVMANSIEQYFEWEAQQPKPVFHKVKNGDNLGIIANKYNTTVNEIKKANGLTNNIIKVGQELYIPEKSK